MANDMTDQLQEELIKIRNGRDASFFDLTSVDQLTLSDIALILELATKFKQGKTAKLTLCKGRSQVNAFFEASTRTMSSFDLAAKNLGMDTTSVGSASSSTKKGESFIDTVETLSSYNLATLIIRCTQAGGPEFAAKHISAGVINAGDGWHEHPSQALLDAMTMLEEFKSKDLSGRVVTIVGDIMHSRVFGSLVRILKKLNATVRVAAPETFFPDFMENFGVTPYYDADEALVGSDVIYALRVQEERGGGGFIPTLREYSKTFGISPRRLKIAKPTAILMHPGPVVRDIDVHSVLVARHPQSRILTQVENGMAVRKALLWLIAERYDGKVKDFAPL